MINTNIFDIPFIVRGQEVVPGIFCTGVRMAKYSFVILTRARCSARSYYPTPFNSSAISRE